MIGAARCRARAIAAAVAAAAVAATGLACGERGPGDRPGAGDGGGADAALRELRDDDLGYRCDVDFAAVGARLPTGATPVRSVYQLPTSNGFSSATYVIEAAGVPVRFADGSEGTVDQRHRVATFTDHVYRRPDERSFTRDFLWDAYFGARVDGAGVWLGDLEEEDAGYVPGTGIVHVVQRAGGVAVDTWVFAPMHAGTHDLVLIAAATNESDRAAAIDLYALVNAHAGGEGAANGERVAAAGEAIVESRGGDRIALLPIGAPVRHAAAPGADKTGSPWHALRRGADLSGALVSGDDVAVGFQWPADAPLAPGASRWAGVIVSLGAGEASDQALAARARALLAGRTPADVLDAERVFWLAFHVRDMLPPGLTADEEAVFRQSTAVLKMGQVREPGPPHGQILASLPPGGWNLSWPRDAAYAIVALARAGHLAEARDALRFQLDGDAGRYASYLPVDDYLISVARYHGNGVEESDGATCPDGRDAGPNVELDGWGLFLWAYAEYLDASAAAARFGVDATFRDDTLPRVLAGVADPLVACIDPATDTLVPDSSIWERHWQDCFPNGRKHFTYSSLWAVAGLRRAADLSGDARYAEAAERIRAGLLRLHAAAGGPVFEEYLGEARCPVLAGAPEEVCAGCGPYDASVVEAINLGVILPDSALARGTMAALLSRLRAGAHTPGLRRADDGSGTANPYPWYDDQEWVVIDLRAAAALSAIARASGDALLADDARTLVDWITAQARINHGLIGELLSDGIYTPEDDADRVRPGADRGGEVQGSVPMCGFGPGAYLLALGALYGE